MSEPSPKRTHSAMGTSGMKIGTHDGSFHCDEALACFMLKQLPQYQNATIVRTRDPALLETCDIVVDVGAKYEPERHRYDHHQREFDGCMESLSNGKHNSTIKLSSAGLVYLHFGRDVIAAMSGISDDKTLDAVWTNMYNNFVEEIDAVDNGISQYDGESRYRVSSTISARVGRLHPSWRDGDGAMDAQFEKAMALVGSEFADMLHFYAVDWLPARDIVIECLEKRFEVDPSGEIIELTTNCPWKAHLFQLEEELGTAEEPINIKYALFTDTNGKWRVMCVPVTPGSFQSRKPLPEPWRGLRDQQLSDKMGIPGGVFVHAGGFIGGNETREGALAMAKASLSL